MNSRGKRDSTVHEIFRVVSRFPRYISCYFAESRLPLGQCTYGVKRTMWSMPISALLCTVALFICLSFAFSQTQIFIIICFVILGLFLKHFVFPYIFNNVSQLPYLQNFVTFSKISRKYSFP